MRLDKEYEEEYATKYERIYSDDAFERMNGGISRRRTLRVFSTHMEISPYFKGDNPLVEKMFSKCEKYGIQQKWTPISFMVNEDTLYLPRGTSVNKMANIFSTSPTYVKADDCKSPLRRIEITGNPRNNIQKDSIDFLLNQGKFSSGLNYNQFGLNIDTGDGKTFCMIYAIAKMNMKAIIVTHKTRIKDQWVAEFLSKTNIDESRIISIDGSPDMQAICRGKKEADIYIVNHQTIASFAKEHSWNAVRRFFHIIQVGVKVYDEAHKFFENCLKIDFFSNVKRTYYLTATFTRNDKQETQLFYDAYSTVYRFGEETFNYDGKRKHQILVVVLFNSKPNYVQEKAIVHANIHGFSSFNYIDYELKKNPDEHLKKAILKVIHSVENLEGKILISSPKIESVDMIADMVRKETNKSVGAVHSGFSREENNRTIEEKDIISSTIKGIGEGDDIKGLRVSINTEPMGSAGLIDQWRGRLREYSPDKDTYLFYLVDTGIPHTFRMFNRNLWVFKRKCKKIIYMNLDDEL